MPVKLAETSTKERLRELLAAAGPKGLTVEELVKRFGGDKTTESVRSAIKTHRTSLNIGAIHGDRPTAPAHYYIKGAEPLVKERPPALIPAAPTPRKKRLTGADKRRYMELLPEIMYEANDIHILDNPKGTLSALQAFCLAEERVLVGRYNRPELLRQPSTKMLIDGFDEEFSKARTKYLEELFPVKPVGNESATKALGDYTDSEVFAEFGTRSARLMQSLAAIPAAMTDAMKRIPTGVMLQPVQEVPPVKEKEPMKPVNIAVVGPHEMQQPHYLNHPPIADRIRAKLLTLEFTLESRATLGLRDGKYDAVVVITSAVSKVVLSQAQARYGDRVVSAQGTHQAKEAIIDFCRLFERQYEQS